MKRNTTSRKIWIVLADRGATTASDLERILGTSKPIIYRAVYRMKQVDCITAYQADNPLYEKGAKYARRQCNFYQAKGACAPFAPRPRGPSQTTLDSIAAKLIANGYTVVAPD